MSLYKRRNKKHGRRPKHARHRPHVRMLQLQEKKIATTADGSCAGTAATSVERIFRWIKEKEIKPATYGLHY